MQPQKHPAEGSCWGEVIWAAEGSQGLGRSALTAWQLGGGRGRATWPWPKQGGEVWPGCRVFFPITLPTLVLLAEDTRGSGAGGIAVTS